MLIFVVYRTLLLLGDVVMSMITFFTETTIMDKTFKTNSSFLVK